MTRPTPTQLRFLAKLRDEGAQTATPYSKTPYFCERNDWCEWEKVGKASLWLSRITPAGLAVLAEHGL